MPAPKPLILLILDGWGHREAAADNAISVAHTPHWDRIASEQPKALLETSGTAVGLPDGQMGNSEVGHMNIGAGRIVYQELTRIDRAIETGEFETNAALNAALDQAEASKGTVHILGLLSPGGVHSHEDHFLATLKLALSRAVTRVAVHAFLDGRDMPPRSARLSIEKMEAAVAEDSRACIASVSGRYYAMDRDQRWDRVEKAWRALVQGQAEFDAATATEALNQAYERELDDEFVVPTTIDGGVPVADGDVVLFINFRADRARQLTSAFVDADFEGFDQPRPSLGAMVTMTRYQADLPCPAAFEPERMTQLFGGVLANAGLRQLRIAETEKYAHVTYFFNGGEETVFPKEDRVLIPSPRVATYDLQPEMSAPALSKQLSEAIRSQRYDVIVANVANPDMVGHSGVFKAAVEAVEAVDELLGAAIQATQDSGGELLITADHGNVEQMTDPETGQAHTAHTLNPVPFVYVGPREVHMADQGSLRDIAPTMLSLLGQTIPSEMTGQALARIEEVESVS
ncbi:MAG: 2,3-bisphosphoglycerate-independent phosphoglycerate mutase [Pseudomonadota bacterium]